MIYIFQADQPGGEVFEKSMTVREMLRSKRGQRYMVDGVACLRRFDLEHGGPAGCDLWRDFRSDAAGCHPSQAKQFTEWARERGNGTTFDSQGRACFPDRKTRADYLRLRGLHDKNGGYSDG